MFLSRLGPTCSVLPRKSCPYSRPVTSAPMTFSGCFSKYFLHVGPQGCVPWDSTAWGFLPGRVSSQNAATGTGRWGELQVQGLLSSPSLPVKEKQTQVGATSPALLTVPGVYGLVHFSFSCITFLGAAWPSDLDRGQEAEDCWSLSLHSPTDASDHPAQPSHMASCLSDV